MATRMQQRRGTAQQWTDADPILAAGEIGFETDTNQFKIGDGVNAWSDLSYFKNLEDLGGSLDDYALANLIGAANGIASLDSTGNVPLAQLANIIDGAPELLNTINELAAAINDNAGFANTVLTSVDSAQSAAESYADGLITDEQAARANAIADHSAETLSVHGIANTAALVTLSGLDDFQTFIANAYTSLVNDTEDNLLAEIGAAVGAHSESTSNVHGFADISVLTTATQVATAKQEAIDAAANAAATALSSHESDTTNVHGISNTAALATTADLAALTKSSVGLANVDNTADADKPVSTAQANAIATAKAEAIAEVTAVVDAAPEALNTLNELAAALGDDANYAATVTTALDGKVASFTPIVQKTTSYTLSALTERDSMIEVASSSATTITIPANSAVAYPVGTSIDILQTSTGQVTIAGAAGVTVNATPGLKLRTQWSGATLFKRATDTWVVYGDLSA